MYNPEAYNPKAQGAGKRKSTGSGACVPKCARTAVELWLFESPARLGLKLTALLGGSWDLVSRDISTLIEVGQSIVSIESPFGMFPLL